MAICTKHNIMFHNEINETCYMCDHEQNQCDHSNTTRLRPLFDNEIGELVCSKCDKILEHRKNK